MHKLCPLIRILPNLLIFEQETEPLKSYRGKTRRKWSFGIALNVIRLHYPELDEFFYEKSSTSLVT
jgi:hypothetical protein